MQYIPVQKCKIFAINVPKFVLKYTTMSAQNYKSFSFTIFETARIFHAAMFVKLLCRTSQFTNNRAKTTIACFAYMLSHIILKV